MAFTNVTAQLENRSGDNRNDIVTHGIGLLRGELGPADLGVTELRVDDGALQRRVQWRPIGRRYGPQQSGSYKYIEVSYPTDVTSVSPEPTVTISQGTAMILTPFTVTVNTTNGIATASIGFQVNGTTRTIPLSTVIQPGNLLTTPSTNDCKRRYRYRGRLVDQPTASQLHGVGFEIVLDLYSEMDYVNWYVKFYYSLAETATGGIAGNGNAWNARFILLTQNPTIVFTGATAAYAPFESTNYANVTHGSPTTFEIIEITTTGSGRARYNYWPVGFCYRRHGRIYFSAAPGGDPGLDTRGMAMDWPSKNSPPYNFVADYPAYIPTRANAISRLKTFRTSKEAGTAGDPLHNGGLFNKTDSPRGGDAGTFGFGANQCYVMLRAGHPALLDVMEREAFKDSFRLGEYYNLDGSFWSGTTLGTAHPLTNIWHGRIFTPLGTDGLGITYPPDWDDSNSGNLPWNSDGRPWLGDDREHWTTVGQMQAALAGCHYLLLDQFQTLHTESVVGTNAIYLGGGLRPGNIPDPTSARDWGRGSMTSCCTIFEVSGDDRVVAALKERLHVVSEPDALFGDRRMYVGAPGVRSTIPIQNFPITKSGFGGWERGQSIWGSRVSPYEGTAEFNSQALSVNFDRPWVASTAVAGAWAAYKLLLDYDSTSSQQYVNFARYIAGDVAQWIAFEGIVLIGANDANRYRMIRLRWTSIHPRAVNPNVGELPEFTDLDAFNYATFAGRPLVGGTSGASGSIISCSQFCVPMDINFPDNRDYIVWLRDCNGQRFVDGEAFTITGTSITGIVENSLTDAIGVPSTAINNDASFLTRAQFEQVFTTTALAWTTIGGLRTYQGQSSQPLNVFFYSSYASYAMAPVMVAWNLARAGFYTSPSGNRNSEVEVRCGRVYTEMKRLEDASLTTTWTDFQDWAGTEPVPTTGGTPPGVPGNLRNTNVTQTSFTANWDPGFGPVTQFNVQYRQGTVGPFVPAGSTGGTTFNLPIGGLTANTLYEWQVEAVNGNGSSGFSAALQVTTSAVVTPAPAAPTDPATTNVAQTSVTFLFTQADNLVERFETRYRRVIDAPVWTTGPEVLPQFIDARIQQPFTGLVADTDYEFQARARAGTQFSAFTASANAHTLAVAGSPPGTPTDLVADSITSGSARVFWTPADLTADLYRVTYAKTGGGSFEVSTEAPSIQVELDTLDADAEYTVTVIAANGNGDSPSSDPVVFRTLAVLVAPTAPINLGTREIHPTSAIVTWTLTSTSQTSQLLRYKKTADVSWTTISGLPPGAVEWPLNDLLPETEYEAEVAERNSAGDSAWSDSVAFTTLALPAHSHLNPAIFGDIFNDFL